MAGRKRVPKFPATITVYPVIDALAIGDVKDVIDGFVATYRLDEVVQRRVVTLRTPPKNEARPLGTVTPKKRERKPKAKAAEVGYIIDGKPLVDEAAFLKAQ